MTDHPIKNSDAQVVSFPNTSNTENESARRLKQEVERLAALPTVEWIYYIESDGYAARFDVDKATLRRMVEATIKEREKKAHEAKADDRRAEQKQERDDRRSRQEQERARKEAERVQERAGKEARRKYADKQKEFAAINKLPRADRDSRLVELARRLGEDPATLCTDFEEFIGAEGDSIAPPSSWDVVAWDEPVDVAALLQDLDHKIRKHAALGEHYVTALVLWIAMDWIHNEVATHSPFLDIGSVDEEVEKPCCLGCSIGSRSGLASGRTTHPPTSIALPIAISRPRSLTKPNRRSRTGSSCES
jgi:hypothetical protein